MRWLLRINFMVAVLVLVSGGALSMTEASFFEFNEDLYGALDNNLRMIMLYLAVTEIAVVAFCIFTKKFELLTLMGFFLILMIGSMQFYGEVNTVAIDSNFTWFFLYTGLSHFVFGMSETIAKNETMATKHSHSDNF